MVFEDAADAVETAEDEGERGRRGADSVAMMIPAN
jgi:hypothetical protein